MSEANESLMRNVKSMLSAKYYKMNDTFLRDCINYFINENDSQNISAIQDFVIAQWQLNDLREINTESRILPPNLVQQKITTLRGTYHVQLDKMYDISVSKLKQIHKIRNVSSFNLEVTKAQNKETHDWNPTSKRMYQFFLTDGIQDVIAIEYKPLRQFKDVLLPGVKLMIIGPVICRKGVILLEEKNVKEMGGEVGRLLITNALENILARSLNLPEHPDPYNENKTPTDNLESAFVDEFNVDDVVPTKHENSENNHSARATNTFTDTSTSNEFNDQNRDTNNYQFAPVKNQSTRRNNSHDERPLMENTNADEFPDDFDEYFELAEDFYTDINHISTESDKLCSSENNCAIAIHPSASTEAADLFKESKETKPLKLEDKECLVDDIIEIPDDDFEWCDNVEVKKVNDTKAKIQQREESCSPKKEESRIQEISTNVSELSQLSLNNTKIDSVPAKPTTSFGSSNLITSPVTKNKRSATMVSPLMASPPKVKCIQETPKLSKADKKITNFTVKFKADLEEAPKTHVLICDVLTVSVTDSSVRRVVKAKVANFDTLGKQNNCWHLEATLTDGSGSIDVTFASEVLERIIGFGVDKFSEMKKKGKTDPNIKTELRQVFRKSEMFVRKLDSLMELELSKDKKPTVIKIMNSFCE